MAHRSLYRVSDKLTCTLPSIDKPHAVEVLDVRAVPLSAAAGGAAAGERRRRARSGPSSWQYYVHYQGLDRRHDRWVEEEELQSRAAAGTSSVAAASSSSSASAVTPLKVRGRAAAASSSSPVSAAAAAAAASSSSSPSVFSFSASHSSSTGRATAGRRPGKRRRSEQQSPASSSSNIRHTTLSTPPKLSGAHQQQGGSGLSSPSSSRPSSDDDAEHSHQPKDIHSIRLGSWLLDCWYWSPYPPAYRTRTLSICQYCFRYTRNPANLATHTAVCPYRQQPPGRRIYTSEMKGKGKGKQSRGNRVSVWEVDGAGGGGCELYCQCLCLLSKLFIDHKTIFYHVSPFTFYVLTEAQRAQREDGEEEERELPAAYFSKEKQPNESNNLSCIVTLPHKQKQGYGRLLIALSYELTRREHCTGGPERPLSDLALISYTSYWSYAVASLLLSASSPAFVSIGQLADQTGIDRADVVSAMRELGLEKKEEKGELGIRLTAADRTRLRQRLRREEANRSKRADLTFDSDLLHWQPRIEAAAATERQKRGGGKKSRLQRTAEDEEEEQERSSGKEQKEGKKAASKRGKQAGSGGQDAGHRRQSTTREEEEEEDEDADAEEQSELEEEEEKEEEEEDIGPDSDESYQQKSSEESEEE